MKKTDLMFNLSPPDVSYKGGCCFLSICLPTTRMREPPEGGDSAVFTVHQTVAGRNTLKWESIHS